MKENFKPRTVEDDRQSRENVKSETFGQIKESFGNVSGVKATALISLILGIISIMFGISVVIGLGAGIAAIILGVKHRKTKAVTGNSMALAGIICGAIGVFIGMLVIVCFAWFGFRFFETSNSINDTRNTINSRQQDIIKRFN